MWPNRSFHFIRSLNRAKCIFCSRHHPQIHSIQRIWNIILCFDIYLFVFLLLAVGRHASMSNINYRQCCACWLIICSIFTTSLDSTRNFLFTILCWTWRKSGNEREIQKAFRKQQQSIHVYISSDCSSTSQNYFVQTTIEWIEPCVCCVCVRERLHLKDTSTLWPVYSRPHAFILESNASFALFPDNKIISNLLIELLQLRLLSIQLFGILFNFTSIELWIEINSNIPFRWLYAASFAEFNEMCDWFAVPTFSLICINAMCVEWVNEWQSIKCFSFQLNSTVSFVYVFFFFLFCQ